MAGHRINILSLMQEKIKCNMDIIIVCHTEFGFVLNREIVFDKKAIQGASKGPLNLVKIS